MQTILPALIDYVSDTRRLDSQPSSTENSFYSAIKNLTAAVLKERLLPFGVRVNTSEFKGKARDMPGFVLGDDKMLVGVHREVKRPAVALEDLAVSTEQNDQIGRYLAETGVVLLSNVRGLGLLGCVPGYDCPTSGTVPPEKRAVIKTVDPL